MTAPTKFNTEKVRFVLDKRNINNIPCQVKFAMDVSGSTTHLFRDGTIQKVMDKIFTIAMEVDIDKSLDFAAFDTDAYPLPSVTDQNITGYIDKHLSVKNSKFWGGTKYAPVIVSMTKEIIKSNKPSFLGRLFGGVSNKKVLPAPTLVIMITDGENDDPSATEAAIIETQKVNAYWQLVGIGYDESTFHFIKKMADKYPNVGYTPITNIATYSEEDLFDSILNDEFAEWIKRFQ